MQGPFFDILCLLIFQYLVNLKGANVYKFFQRDHWVAIGAATAVTICDIQEEKSKGNLYDPTIAIDSFEEAYNHAVERFDAPYKD